MSAEQDFQNLLTTIKTDLQEGLQLAEEGAVAAAGTIWGLVKQLFVDFTAGQVTILTDVLEEFEQDELAGMSLEQVETRLLSKLTGEELALVTLLPSEAIQAFIAAFKLGGAK